MSNTIQKVIFTGPRQVEIATESVRDLQPREVRIKTILSGISRGTEMNFYLGADRIFDPRDGSDIAHAIRELTAGRGADVAIEVSGVYAGLQEAIRVVGYSGRVVAASWLPGAGEGLRLGEEFHLNRVRLLSSQSGGINPLITDRWDKARRSKALLELVPKMNLKGLITHRFPINDAQQAYQMVDNNPQELLQVILTYE